MRVVESEVKLFEDADSEICGDVALGVEAELLQRDSRHGARDARRRLAVDSVEHDRANPREEAVRCGNGSPAVGVVRMIALGKRVSTRERCD